jgi:hypothetical protein
VGLRLVKARPPVQSGIPATHIGSGFLLGVSHNFLAVRKVVLVSKYGIHVPDHCMNFTLSLFRLSSFTYLLFPRRKISHSFHVRAVAGGASTQEDALPFSLVSACDQVDLRWKSRAFSNRGQL